MFSRPGKTTYRTKGKHHPRRWFRNVVGRQALIARRDSSAIIVDVPSHGAGSRDGPLLQIDRAGPRNDIVADRQSSRAGLRERIAI